MKKSTVIIVCLVALALFYAPSLLASPALTFNPAGGGNALNQDQSVGWDFNVLSPITVTGLGWWDQTGSGIPLAHQVGIWNPVGNLLASVTVPSGTGAALDGQFRTVSISPVTLGVGTGYIVGGEEFSGDTERLACGAGGICGGALDIVTIPQISFVNGTFSSLGSGFVRPSNFTAAHDGLFGPSFSGAAAVPEPATILLLGFGLVGLVGARRKFRKSS